METYTQQVALKALRFYAFHGYFPEEQILGNEFFVDVDVSLINVASTGDELGRTIDYQKLYEVVSEEMKQPKKLLETVAENVIGKVRQLFPQVEQVKVRIKKSNPPFGGDSAHAEVDLLWNRNY